MSNLITGDPERDRELLLKHLPLESELSMQLLKGHLVLEQIFRDLLDLFLVRPECLRGEKGTSLTSHAVICLVEALTPKSFPHPWAFIAAKRLNKARNSLAHKIDDVVFRAECKEFVEFVKRSDPSFADQMRGVWKVPEAYEFATCVSGLCSAISHIKPVALVLRREV